MHVADGELNHIMKNDFETIHAQHWEIEQYHRTIKQVCHIEHFQVRGKTAVNNHCFAALFTFVQLQVMRVTDVINNCYRLQRDLFNGVISNFIGEYSPKIAHMKPIFQAVNA